MRPSRKLMLSAFIVLAVVSLAIFGRPKTWLSEAIVAVERLGPWAPVAFTIVYAFATVLMVPGSALTLAAGTLFGVVWGTCIVSVASTLGASLAFLVGRHLARDAIAARLAARPAFAVLDRALRDEGWKIVALARLSPLFPFTLLNYALGLSNVRFMHYVLASWMAMLPGTVLYVYLGSLARAGVQGDSHSTAQWVIYSVGLVATALITMIVTKKARAAIRERGLAET